MAEKRTTKQTKVAPEVTVAPEEVEVVETTDVNAEVAPDTVEDTEVLETGEITEIRDNEDEVTEVPKELAEQEERIQQLADEVERGAHGSGRERMLALGDDYGKVQQEVTRRIRKRQQ